MLRLVYGWNQDRMLKFLPGLLLDEITASQFGEVSQTTQIEHFSDIVSCDMRKDILKFASLSEDDKRLTMDSINNILSKQGLNAIYSSSTNQFYMCMLNETYDTQFITLSHKQLTRIYKTYKTLVKTNHKIPRGKPKIYILLN